MIRKRCVLPQVVFQPLPKCHEKQNISDKISTISSYSQSNNFHSKCDQRNSTRDKPNDETKAQIVQSHDIQFLTGKIIFLCNIHLCNFTKCSCILTTIIFCITCSVNSNKWIINYVVSELQS